VDGVGLTCAFAAPGRWNRRGATRKGRACMLTGGPYGARRMGEDFPKDFPQDFPQDFPKDFSKDFSSG
jgi:hypothetical protein